MRRLSCTLVADGASDRALIPILTWLLRNLCGSLAIQAEYADLRRLRNPPNRLAERILRSVELYPCDLLFVHRDAEDSTIEHRRSEIIAALKASGTAPLPAVCVVPVRMTEAWLLIDEAALRHASGNPGGKQPLNLPSVQRLERLPNPKAILYDLLGQASGLHGRRLRSFHRRSYGYHVADSIHDFNLLQRLAAFRVFASETQQVVAANGWNDWRGRFE